MRSIGYILATNLSHEGILLKVQGQLIALQKRFNPNLCFINYKNTDSFLVKLIAYFIFELKSLFFLSRYPLIYIRYNPKSIILNVLILFMSWIKPIYVEHNTLYSPELAFLKRKKELFLHKFTYFLYRFSNITHIGVNQELCNHLKHSKLNQIIYAQNGYLCPSDETIEEDKPLLKKLTEFKKKFKFCAIFCGNGYAWHGVEEVISELNKFPEIGLVIIGPFSLPPATNILHISFLESASLAKIIESCDFAISTFRWDIINITEGSPLKSRQYLCHGCPMIVNYYDSALDYKELADYIIDFRQHSSESFKLITNLKYSKSKLKTIAQKQLSWDTYFNTIFKK
jgi:hypothetical protein